MNNRERQDEREKKSGQSTDREKRRVVTKTEEEIVEGDGKSKVFDEWKEKQDYKKEEKGGKDIEWRIVERKKGRVVEKKKRG